MEAITMADSWAGLMNFFAYFTAALVLLAVFCFIYGRVTPYHEITLIKEGKTAPAISFGGAASGFVVPLASAIIHSVGFVDMVIWALIAMLVQIAVFLGLRIIFTDMIRDIADDRVAPATLLAVFSLAIGILDAACMSY